METSRTDLPKWLAAFVLCAIAAPVCVRYLDRAVAEFADAHLSHAMAWIWLDRILKALDLVVIAALVYPLGCGIRVAAGFQLPRWTAGPLRCSWAAIWAVAASIVLKRVFGRSSPAPDYIEMHQYRFHFLHGGATAGAFPSASAAISVAIAAALWPAIPRWRWLICLLIGLLLATVVAGNYHWVSDVIAGVFLGATIGWLATILPLPGVVEAPGRH
jgi:membrane-associated phospholipid phosphatase